MKTVPAIRIRKGNKKQVRPDGDFVLYWMIANRRLDWNFSLDRAIELAEELNKPLVVLEALDTDYKWTCDRFHAFILKGMRDNFLKANDSDITYYPYVEPAPGKGSGLLYEMSKHACAVVTDDYPAFFIPQMLKKLVETPDRASPDGRASLQVLLETVDSNGLLPMDAGGREFTTAYSFRRFLQKTLPEHLMDMPQINPLKNIKLKKIKRLPGQITEKWPQVNLEFLENIPDELKKIPIDHNVQSIKNAGGSRAGKKLLKKFITEKLPDYDEIRNHPQEDATSGLSPYLHFGHISAHEVFYSLQKYENWHPGKLDEKTNGRREGWWGMSRSAEAFIDQLITWREIGFNMCRYNKDYDKYKTLPNWAKETLKIHEADEREYVYRMEQFENAETHDPLWNAAQAQLVKEGIIHNYLRMLWGKKIFEWTKKPADALEIMIHLNNKYALDGRDPNSYSGIFWTLGRYDRAWGPERKIFGKVRYMSSKNTARKVKTAEYIKKYS